MSDHLTLLIVDDDNVFRPRLARAFEGRGFQVWHTGSPEEAAQLTREHDPELGILDLRINAEHSGLEVLRDLLEVSPHMKIVMLTGYGSIATAVDAIRLGAASYITKPADVDDILNAFDRAGAPVLEPGEPCYDEAPTLARAEWEHISRVLSDCGGNVSQAARILGIHRRSLQRKLSKHPPAK
jgi:two-component system response regulator RegA